MSAKKAAIQVLKTLGYTGIITLSAVRKAYSIKGDWHKITLQLLELVNVVTVEDTGVVYGCETLEQFIAKVARKYGFTINGVETFPSIAVKIQLDSRFAGIVGFSYARNAFYYQQSVKQISQPLYYSNVDGAIRRAMSVCDVF